MVNGKSNKLHFEGKNINFYKIRPVCDTDEAEPPESSSAILTYFAVKYPGLSAVST